MVLIVTKTFFCYYFETNYYIKKVNKAVNILSQFFQKSFQKLK